MMVVLSFGLKECQSFVLMKAPPWLTFSVSPSMESDEPALDSLALKYCVILTCLRLLEVAIGFCVSPQPRLVENQMSYMDQPEKNHSCMMQISFRNLIHGEEYHHLR